MTDEDRIRALEKIYSSEERKVSREGRAKAHADYAKIRSESAGSLSGLGTGIGVGGGLAGGYMTLKGVKQMLDKGPSIAPAGAKPVYSPGNPYAGIPTRSVVKMGPTGALTATEPNFSAIFPRSEVSPKLQGKRLALKGGILGLGSLGLSAALHGMANSNREKANEHIKRLHEIESQLR